MVVIRLILESQEGIEPPEIWLNPNDIKQMGKQISKLKNFMSQGYKLKDVIGKGAIADFLRSELQKYRVDIKNYKVDALKIAKQTLRMNKKE